METLCLRNIGERNGAEKIQIEESDKQIREREEEFLIC